MSGPTDPLLRGSPQGSEPGPQPRRWSLGRSCRKKARMQPAGRGSLEETAVWQTLACPGRQEAGGGFHLCLGFSGQWTGPQDFHIPPLSDGPCGDGGGRNQGPLLPLLGNSFIQSYIHSFSSYSSTSGAGPQGSLGSEPRWAGAKRHQGGRMLGSCAGGNSRQSEDRGSRAERAGL